MGAAKMAIDVRDRSRQALLGEIASLRAQVNEYEEQMRAIRAGEVDAIFIGHGCHGRALTLGGGMIRPTAHWSKR